MAELRGILGLKKKNTPKKKKGFKPGRTTQSSIRYVECYKNGVIQTDPGFFSKMFEFDDVSFKTKSDVEQEEMFVAYERFLNSLAAGEDFYFSIVNLKGDKKTDIETVIPQAKGDEYDPLRKEMASVIRDKIKTSRNDIVTKKYLTVSICGDEIDKVMRRFDEITGELENNFKKCTQEPIRTVSLEARLELLSLIMNGRDNISYWFEHQLDGSVKIDWNQVSRQGLTTKDLISPELLKYKASSFQIGENRYGEVMYMDKIANWMNTNFLSELSETNFESVITLHIQPILQQDALKHIHNQSVNITAEVMNKQKELLRDGYSPDMIPMDLKNAKNQIDSLQDDLMNRDQRLFQMSLYTCHFGENEEITKEYGKILRNLAAKYMSELKPLMYMQERGFMSVLPFGRDEGFKKRFLTTESLAIFIPFNEANVFDKGGFYYGVNSVNKSVVIYNRLHGMNYNGLVLGTSGSGKSFSAKREMANAIINTTADVYIIDPDGEYTPMAEAFGGTVVKISPGNGVYINPFDLDIDTSYDNDLNPLAMKTDFICGMLETMIGTGAKLTPTQRSIVDRCIKHIYRPYFEHLSELPPGPDGKKITIDKAHCPTMQALFEELWAQPQPEAQTLALIMESYTSGTYDTFAKRTNVDLDTRIVVYDIKSVGTNLRELALKVCMNDVWTKMMENRRKNKWTWFYVDEFHLLLSNGGSTSEFLKSIWKRARKYQGVPTGITQNVEDLLQSPDARTIINNSSFIYMLNQSRQDRNMLKDLLKLSDNDMEYVTNVDPGHGLIKTSKSVIPFEDRFPEDTELFKIMTTKPKDADE